MADEMTWKQAIDIVLADSSEPMHYKEIAEEIIARGLRRTMGATPAATVNAQISGSIKHEGDGVRYSRVAAGTFTPAKQQSASAAQASVDKPETTDESQYDLITSFGMFWRRSLVEWSATTQVLGMQQIGATPVDFYGQLVVYLLYDGREVVYVGRSKERPLGKRLYEHTVDRLSTRWGRFSWFGLRPVSDSGELGDLPTGYAGDAMIPALEAMLIEAVEPRQNRKRGDDLAAVEYLQHEDPAIKRRRTKQILENAIERL
ncbi:MAG: HTH domain-containing protein [Planctomycetota bacterium]